MDTENKLIQMYKDYTVNGKTSLKGMSEMSYVFLKVSEEDRVEFLDFLEEVKQIEA
jgi:hypothetical protein